MEGLVRPGTGRGTTRVIGKPASYARRTICALDLATRTGFCIGAPGAHPRSGSFRLKAPSEPVENAYLNLFRFLEAEFCKEEFPALVIKEAKMPIAAQLKRSNGEAGIDLQCSLHANTALACRLFGVPCISVSVATIRKHLLGRANCGSSEETKLAVVMRCRLLGLVPRNTDDTDQCDAVAAWEYACAHHARRPPAEFGASA